jgi:glycosyltransferase involved in cell wall biosynthesis
MPEVGGDVAQYFEPGDADSLAESLKGVLINSVLSARLRQMGPRRAATFAPETTAQQTAEAYRAVLADH